MLIRTLISVLLASISVGVSSANIILNPSFESGTGTDATDWLEAGGPSGSTSRSELMPNTGGFSVHMQANHFINPAAPTPYSVEQTQPVGSIDNGLNYDLSFFAKVDSLDFNGFDMFYQILWLDQDASDGGGVRGETLTSLITAGINTSYQLFRLSDIDVPDGADSFQLRFQLSPGAVEDIANGLYIDDVVLKTTSAPQPGDFDLDEDVDGADFVLLQRTTAGSAGLDNWQTSFGIGTGNLAVAIAVPEPSTTILLTLSYLILALNRNAARV